MKLNGPSKIYLPEDNDQVKKFLTFHDRSVDFQLRKMKQNYRWAQNDPEGYTERIELLKSQSTKTLLFYDEAGNPYTYSGLWNDLINRFGWSMDGDLDSDLFKVSPKTLPWASIPPEMYYYQKEAVEALIKSRHGAIELPTGSGKSLIILNLAKHYGCKTIIATPSCAITDQLYNDFVKYFGKKYVGKYGDGKKEYKKLFTIAVAQSLTRLEEGSEAWEELYKAQILIWDESHTTPAETFDKVCLGVASNAYYRFFVSATQLRNDGSEMILKGITGPVVYSKGFKELVDQGYLSKLVFKTFTANTYGTANKSDAKAETRSQLYLNPNVNSLAGSIASQAVTLGDRQVLIIIEEFKQFLQLKNFLKVPYEFVHGGASKDAKELLPSEYWKCDTQQIVADFNSGKTRCLIGTSAISTGVDLKPTGCIIYLQGGTSEIKVRQALGRGTRIFLGKKDCWVIDFKVQGSNTMERHYKIRKEIYESLGDVTEHAR